MAIDKHIYFSANEVLKLEEYCKKNKLPLSKAVCKLVNLSLDNIEVLGRIDKLQKDISHSIEKQNIIFSLLKQLYSDLDFENITDPKKSKAVNEFMNKIKGNKYND